MMLGIFALQHHLRAIRDSVLELLLVLILRQDHRMRRNPITLRCPRPLLQISLPIFLIIHNFELGSLLCHAAVKRSH